LPTDKLEDRLNSMASAGGVVRLSVLRSDADLDRGAERRTAVIPQRLSIAERRRRTGEALDLINLTSHGEHTRDVRGIVLFSARYRKCLAQVT